MNKYNSDKKLKEYVLNYIDSIKGLEKLKLKMKSNNPPSLSNLLNITDGVNQSIEILENYLVLKYNLNRQEVNDLVINICNKIENK